MPDHKKGQSLSGDFILSIMIFLVAMSIIIPGFLRVSDSVRSDEARRELELVTIFSSDALIKTTGFPKDWNITNVITIGLADDGGKLNTSKIRSLMDMNYSTSRKILGFDGYNFNLTFSDINNYRAMSGFAESPAAYFYVNNDGAWDVMNNSGLVWDIYYGGPGIADAGDARNLYTGQKIDMFNSMVGNSSLYKTIIVEEPELLQSQVSINQLQSFVAGGGLLIYEGSADLIETGFSMHGFSGAASTANVTTKDEFIDTNVGEAVTFSNPTWYFTEQSGDTKLVNVIDESQSRTLAGRWTHGFGEVYYLTDLNGTAGAEPLSSVLHLAGKSIGVGAQAQQTSTISVTQRFGIIAGKNQPVKITVLVWA